MASELAKQIVLAIASQDAFETEAAFEAKAAELMMDALEAKRAQVAANMFRDPVVDEEENDEEVVEESFQLTEEAMSSIAHQVESAAEHHAYMKKNWGAMGSKHAHNFADHEKKIARMHGPEALDHIRAASECFPGGNATGAEYMEGKSGKGSREPSHLEDWHAVEKHLAKATNAAYKFHSSVKV